MCCRKEAELVVIKSLILGDGICVRVELGGAVDVCSESSACGA